MDSTIFCRPYYSTEKRRVLIRSTGSFSTVEENLVAPTPRKFPNLASSSSPKYGRRDKRKNEDPSLFGEAGSELQNILFHPQNLLAAATQLVTLPISSTPLEESHTIVPVKITPLRTSNPITLNSPFHIEERTSSTIGASATSSALGKMEKKLEKTTPLQISSTARLYPANGRLRTNTHYPSTRKELNRTRSLSWPGNAKLEVAC